MDKQIEVSLINTYRKIRDSPNLTYNEICGLFINFYYQASNVKGGLDISLFNINKQNDILCIRMKENLKCGRSKLIYDLLSELTISDYYSLWLRSSWENPNEDSYINPIVNCVISVNNFLKTREKNNNSLLKT